MGLEGKFSTDIPFFIADLDYLNQSALLLTLFLITNGAKIDKEKRDQNVSNWGIFANSLGLKKLEIIFSLILKELSKDIIIG